MTLFLVVAVAVNALAVGFVLGVWRATPAMRHVPGHPVLHRSPHLRVLPPSREGKSAVFDWSEHDEWTRSVRRHDG